MDEIKKRVAERKSKITKIENDIRIWAATLNVDFATAKQMYKENLINELCSLMGQNDKYNEVLAVVSEKLLLLKEI